MKSFSILRTNPGLTTNVKVVVDTNYNLYLDSINSAPELDIDRFKKFQFNKNNFFDELIPYFFKDFPVDLAFDVKYSNDNSNMSNDFANQYDDIYQMGARNISNNKNYQEEYEFFAPLYVFKHSIPKYFVIFRVDGPGLNIVNKENFRTEILENFKTVKVFDLTKKTALGEWIDRNFSNDRSFPKYPLEVDFRNLEFTRWIGIDYDSGGYTYKSRFMDESLEDENTLFDFERSFFDGFKSNKIIYPHIVNFNFLFDDEPATPTSLRKWSINRYLGFYLEDLEIVDSITPFVTPKLKSDIQILNGNILYSDSGDPFVGGFGKTDMWVEYLGDFYKVERYEVVSNSLSRVRNSSRVSTEDYSNVSRTIYKIISEIDLTGKEDQLNQKEFLIDDQNRILNLNGDPYVVSGFELSDVHLIEIDGKHHNLILDDDGYIRIHTDYGFYLKDEYRFEYYINSPDQNYYRYVDLEITNDNQPKKFNIYRANFTDVKDFDTSIVNSDFARYEYEKKEDITRTEEPKLYTTDLRFKSIPPPINDYTYKGEVEYIPASSDYTANLETFRIVDKDLSELWRKNPISCRWVYQNSLSNADYSYLLNNNTIHGDFNRTADTNDFTPRRQSRNLDYFYTINSGTTSYVHHSLHIEKNHDDVQDTSFRFELDKYLNRYSVQTDYQTYTYSLDYFEYLFGSEIEFLDGTVIRNSRKYSYFEAGEAQIPNTTLFRGIKFKLFEVDSLKRQDSMIDSINLFGSNVFQDYKLSVLLSRNVQEVNQNGDIEDIINWGRFLDNQFYGGSVSFVTSLTEAPTNINIGDIVDIRQSYPYANSTYEGISIVTYVGLLNSGYGFVIDKPWGLTSSSNPGFYRINFNWKIIKPWETDISYLDGDLVLYDDIVYEVLSDNTISNPNLSPNTSSDFDIYSGYSPFWNPGSTYSEGDWVYRNGEYYVRNDQPYSVSGDFWRATHTYSIGEYAMVKGKFFKAKEDSISSKPLLKSRKVDISVIPMKWEEDSLFTTSISSSTYSSIWDSIQIWNPNELYYTDTYVVHNEILYKAITDVNNEDVPSQSPNWYRVYSFVPDTNYVYGTQSNPFIHFNNNTYLCTFNKDFTLNSGITIYINKKWKNVLVNICVNDNTTLDLDNVERDILYNDLNSRLTAANFIQQINDLDSKYDFADYTTYVVIEEDGSAKKYRFDINIERLPYMIICEGPDKFELRSDNLRYRPVTLEKNVLKPTRFLVNGSIDNITKLNYYNDNPLGYDISKVDDEKINLVNYNKKIKNIDRKQNLKSDFNSSPMYRHSGPYMPAFYEIDLFKRDVCEFEDLIALKTTIDVVESDGSIDSSFITGTGFNGEAYISSFDSLNRIIIVGGFTEYNGMSASCIVRLNYDGSPDTEFIQNNGSGFSGGVPRSIIIDENGKILIGGFFTSFNGFSYNNLVRLNPDGTLDTLFNTSGSGFDGPVYKMQIQPDGRVICSGSFNTYNGSPSSGIIRVYQNGSIDTSFSCGSGIDNPSGWGGYTCTLQSDGKIVLGGIFTTYNGASASNIVRLNPNGSIDYSFNSGSGTSGGTGIVFSSEQQGDGKILIGGNFNMYNGITASYITRLLSNGNIDPEFIQPFTYISTGQIQTISFQENDKIVIAGFGSGSPYTPPRISRLNSDGTVDPTLDGSAFATNGVKANIDSQGRILCTGQFVTYNGDTYNRILRFDISTEETEEEYLGSCPKYKFNEQLTLFGIIKDRVISKINRKENILKLRNDKSNNSIYPMLDEFGYLTSDFMIFKSTWDFEYHIECRSPSIREIPSVVNHTLQAQYIQSNRTI